MPNIRLEEGKKADIDTKNNEKSEFPAPQGSEKLT
jgi:hypothetical protein